MNRIFNSMSKQVNILAVLRSKDRIEDLESALEAMDTVNLEIRVDAWDQVAPMLVNSHVPDVLLVEIGLENSSEIDLLSRVIRENESQMAAIATAENATLDGIRRLMRVGVADFVPQPMSRADLLGALETAVSKLEPNRGGHVLRSQVLSFIGSCGGAGSTTLAVQAAVDLMGRNKKNRKSVCLLDFDLQFGNAALSLDIQSKDGLTLILEAPGRLDGAFLRASMSRHASGIDVLSAPPSIVPLDVLTPEIVTRIIDLAREEYDYVVIDMPHVWTIWTAKVFHSSDLVVLVAELNVTALQRTRRQLDLLKDQGIEDTQIAVVANRFEKSWGANTHRRQAEKVLGRKIHHVVRNDPKTACAARDLGVPLREVKSGNKIDKDLHEFLKAAKQSIRTKGTLSMPPQRLIATAR
jgi:pilus assembly protein CpaE